MDAIILFLMEYGYLGMGVSAFIAGSVFPFSSELVLAGLLLSGLSPWPLIVSATAGNVLGSWVNYWVRSRRGLEWIERYLHVPREKIFRTQRWMQHGGAWMGFFCFLPILGSVLSVTLGFMRSGVVTSFISILLGKALRYALLIWALDMV